MDDPDPITRYRQVPDIYWSSRLRRALPNRRPSSDRRKEGASPIYTLVSSFARLAKGAAKSSLCSSNFACLAVTDVLTLSGPAKTGQRSWAITCSCLVAAIPNRLVASLR